MLNRRELIASSVALTLTAPAAASRLAASAAPVTASAASGNPSAEGFPATHFLASLSLSEAHDAAAKAAARGARIIWIGKDLTPVYTWLDLALRTAPSAIAGVTSAHELFAIERLAWDRGLRMASRCEIGAGTGRTAAVEWRLVPRTRT